MNPLKKGFLTNPEFCNGDVQYNFLTKLLYAVRYATGQNQNFMAVYTPGNHCYDCVSESFSHVKVGRVTGKELFD